jgi:hypothetical protein
MADQLGVAPAVEAPDPQETLGLTTVCECGHKRKDHRGLRIQAKGPCRECGCEEFRPPSSAPESRDETTERIRAALDQVEGLQAIVASLRAQLTAADSHRLKKGRVLRRYFHARSARS